MLLSKRIAEQIPIRIDGLTNPMHELNDYSKHSTQKAQVDVTK